MVQIAQWFLRVLVGKFLIYNSNVFVNKDFIGMVSLVTIHHVLVANFGLDLLVLALSAKIIMDQCVLNVLTARNGIKLKMYVNVRMGINGIAFFVRKVLFVLEIWYGMIIISNVYVLLGHIGVAIDVFQSQNV